jgi:hypothetical protein
MGAWTTSGTINSQEQISEEFLSTPVNANVQGDDDRGLV